MVLSLKILNLVLLYVFNWGQDILHLSLRRSLVQTTIYNFYIISYFTYPCSTNVQTVHTRTRHNTKEDGGENTIYQGYDYDCSKTKIFIKFFNNFKQGCLNLRHENTKRYLNDINIRPYLEKIYKEVLFFQSIFKQ